MAELSTLTNRRKEADITKYNMERIERSLKNARSLKAVKIKPGVGNNQMYALRDKQASVTPNLDKIVKVAEDFCRGLYSLSPYVKILESIYSGSTATIVLQ